MMPTINAVPLLKQNISWHVFFFFYCCCCCFFKKILDPLQYFTLTSFPIYNSFFFQCGGGKRGVIEFF